jgi:hypothetical protein
MDHQQPSLPRYWRSPAGVALAGAMAVGGFYLLTEHTAHVFGVLPYLLVLACPLMHMFMHHGHGGHSHGQQRSADDEQRRQ